MFENAFLQKHLLLLILMEIFCQIVVQQCRPYAYCCFGKKWGEIVGYSRSGGRSGRRVCLSQLSCPINNSKLTWYLTSQCHHSCSMQNVDNQIWKSRIAISTKLKLYITCILPIFLYGSECWAVTKRDVLKIDALDQWCLRKLLGIKSGVRMARWDGQQGNPACQLLSKHGVLLCSAILQECQTRQMPGVS